MTAAAGAWGSDLAMVLGPDGAWDMDPGGGSVAGVELVTQRAGRRITTVRGSCRAQPHRGLDVRSWLRSGVLTSTPARIQSELRAELLADPAITRADVGVQWDAATSTLTLTMRLTIGDSAQALVFRLTPSTIKILVNGLPPSWAA